MSARRRVLKPRRKTSKVSELSEFSCAVTGFAGMESEILRLRNTNRESSETLAYLTWRYRASANAPPPS